MDGYILYRPLKTYSYARANYNPSGLGRFKYNWYLCASEAWANTSYSPSDSPAEAEARPDRGRGVCLTRLLFLCVGLQIVILVLTCSRCRTVGELSGI
jgi:hypothetical protein